MRAHPKTALCPSCHARMGVSRLETCSLVKHQVFGLGMVRGVSIAPKHVLVRLMRTYNHWSYYDHQNFWLPLFGCCRSRRVKRLPAGESILCV